MPHYEHCFGSALSSVYMALGAHSCIHPTVHVTARRENVSHHHPLLANAHHRAIMTVLGLTTYFASARRSCLSSELTGLIMHTCKILHSCIHPPVDVTAAAQTSLTFTLSYRTHTAGAIMTVLGLTTYFASARRSCLSLGLTGLTHAYT
jgi:hypothetical protein